ncbi:MULTISPECIES: hypothetical protein [Cyanophyceae]|uniref:hypothetical protein n=1 Tax=Cyanophyceae TaxID=3028117 RepID=UPI00325FB6D5
MFEYLEPDASDNSEPGSLPLPPNSGAKNKGTQSLTPEKVRHLLYGSLVAIVREASPERRIAPSKSFISSATPTPTTGATPSPCPRAVPQQPTTPTNGW